MLMANTICCQAEILAMDSENKERLSKGEAPAYGLAEFEECTIRHGVDYNSAISTVVHI